jgi:hypothetical protein
MNHHDMADDMAEFGARMNVSEGGLRIDTHRPIPACSGPCEQGRKACPCPDACEAEDDAPHVSGAISVCVWLAVASAAVVAAWHVAGVLA